jgi:hypothetical protein
MKGDGMGNWGDRFDYKGYFGHSAHCYVMRNGNAVLCTEAPDNEGTSITNMAEAVADQCATMFGIPHDQLVWIEHYSKENRSSLEESFSLVKFELRGSHYSKRFAHPIWTHVDREEVEGIMGIEFAG